MPRSRKSTILALACAGLAGALPDVSFADHPTLGLQQEGAGSITTLTAMTLPKGARTFGIETQYIANHVIGDADLAEFAEAGEEVHSVEGVSNFSVNAAFGVSDRLTVGFNLPWVTRNNIREGDHHHAAPAAPGPHAPPEVVRLGDASGIGDLTLYSQYRFSGGNDNRRHVAVMLGLKTPTGRTGIRNNEGERFETEHQPGSGSWDALTGLAFTRQWSRVSLDSNVLYAFAGNGAQQSSMGDIFNYNLALSYRAGHRHVAGTGHHHHDTPQNAWDVALEFNGEWRDYVTVGGERQTHTGGNLVYLAPSVRFNSRAGWVAYASLGVPVLANLNGTQSEPKYRMFVGISAALGSRQ